MIGSTHRHRLPRIVDLARSVLDETELDVARKAVGDIEARLKRTKDEAKAAETQAELDAAKEEEKRIADLYEKERYQDGIFNFKEKVIVSFKEPGARPPYWFTWCRYDNRDNYRHLSEWRYQFGYTPVTKDDPYWPENVPLNQNGHYQVGDLCLVKCRLIDHLKRRYEETQLSKNAAKEKIKEFEQAVEAEGDKIEHTLIDELMA